MPITRPQVSRVDILKEEFRDILESDKAPLPRHRVKTCDPANIGTNIRYLMHKFPKMPQKQAVAIAERTLRDACGRK